jgi:hypothetical protein
VIVEQAAFEVSVACKSGVEGYDKFKLGLNVDLIFTSEGKPDINIIVEYVPYFTVHNQMFIASFDAWLGHSGNDIRRIILMAGLKDNDDPMFVPVSHGIEILKAVSVLAKHFIGFNK